MSHDDRIRQLTDLFIEDLRGPIDTSLRQLLSQMMEMASQEEASAVAHARDEDEAARQAALDALRAELEQRHAEESAELSRRAAEDHHARLQELREHLVRDHEAALAALLEQFAEEREAAVQAVRDEMAGGSARSALRQELAGEHEAALADLRDTLSLDREAAVAHVRETLGQEHDAALAGLRDTLTADHEAALAALRETAAQARDAAVHDARRDAAVAYSETLDALRRERDAARAAIAELTDQLAAARARHEQLTDLADAESVAADQSAQNGAGAHVEERQSGLACSDRLLDAVRRLDEAQTLTDVLAVLADHVADASLRTAVLLVQGERLRGWRLAGMGDTTAASLDLALEQAGILGRAVVTAAPVSTDSHSHSTAAPEPPAALPSCLVPPADRVGLALPILVGGRVVAVLYVDDATAQEPVVPSDWPEVVEVVARHAGRCLEALTLARASALPPRPRLDTRPAAARPAAPPAAPPVPGQGDEAQEEESARRHARLLISEIKLYNETLVEQGRREGNLLHLLGSEIERARRLYEEKIPAAVRERVNCFDDEIVRTLAGGDRAVLGQTR